MNAGSTAALCARLAKLPTAVTSDVLGEKGLRDQVLASAIGLIGNSTVVAGPALCVRGEKSAGASKVAFEMDRKIIPGAVVVLATGGYSESAVIGGNLRAPDIVASSIPQSRRRARAELVQRFPTEKRQCAPRTPGPGVGLLHPFPIHLGVL